MRMSVMMMKIEPGVVNLIQKDSTLAVCIICLGYSKKINPV